MTHTDELRERVEELIGPAVGEGVRRVLGVSSLERDRAATAVAADRILAAVHASIAARAMSDEVVEAYIDHLGWLGDDSDVNACRRDIAALLTALGITESEAETP